MFSSPFKIIASYLNHNLIIRKVIVMDEKRLITPQRILFLILFLVLVLVGKKINFSALVGAENQFFTMFQFFGPIAGGFLGSIFGAVAVLGAQLVDFFIVGKEVHLMSEIFEHFGEFTLGLQRSV